MQTIAFLLDYAPQNWCSREDYHVGLCRELAARGADSVLVFAKDVPPDLATRFREMGIKWVTIDYGKGAAHYYRELGKLVRNYSVTSVHICYFDYFSLVPWLARLQGVRSIIFEAMNGGELRARSWKKSLLQVRTRAATLPIKRVIAISDFVKDQLIKAGMPAAKVFRRYLGVDTRFFLPNTSSGNCLASKYRSSPEEVVLVSVSFLNPIKHIDTIIEACGLLSERGVRFKLLLAGDGPLRSELEAMSRRLNLADRIVWLGHSSDPRSLLQGGDVFLLASVGEAFGLVLAEAMACGLPVVAARSGGIVEVVKDRETGFLVSPLNAQAFAEALMELIGNSELRKTMGNRGLKRVEQEFTLENSIHNTVTVYESMKLLKLEPSNAD